MRSKSKLLLTAALCLIMSSCAMLRDLSNIALPQMSFNRVGIQGFGFNEATLLFTFDVDNPNPVGLTAQRYSYDFLINNSSFVSGEHRDRVSISRESSSLLEVPVTIKFTELYRAFSSILQDDQFDYNLNTRFTFDVPGLGEQSIPINAAGSLPVPKIPKFEFGGFDINRISLAGADMELKFQVTNPNVFPLALLGADYSLEVNGRNWLDTALQNPISLASSESSEIVIPVQLNAMQMGSVLGELIAGETDFDYRLTGDANIGAEIEGFEFQDRIPINLTGKFSQ